MSVEDMRDVNSSITGARRSSSADLRVCLQGGTAFHNSNLSREEKTVVERAFRDPEEPVHVLVATTTVAAGVNTPASTVIIVETEFVGEEKRDFTVGDYKNMAGRAGRWGFNEQGKAILIAQTGVERDALMERYVKGRLGALTSTFDPGDVEHWLVRLLAQVDKVQRDDAIRLLANAYGGYLAGRADPKWDAQTRLLLAGLLEQMEQRGLVEQDGGHVQLTLLGRACGASSLSLRSIFRLIDLLQMIPAETLTAERLMALVQGVPDADDLYTPLFRKGQSETIRPREAAQRYGMEIAQSLHVLAADPAQVMGRRVLALASRHAAVPPGEPARRSCAVVGCACP
jgi:replicative superfamily II helicase